MDDSTATPKKRYSSNDSWLYRKEQRIMKYRHAILCVVLVFFAGEGFGQQQDFPRGVYLSGNTKVNYFQLRDSLHLSWVQATGDSIAANPVLHRYVESNPAGLNVISARAEVSPMYEFTRSQQLWIEAEKGIPQSEDDYTYAHFRRFPQTGQQTGGLPPFPEPQDSWKAVAGAEQPGYMASDLRPDDQYYWNRTHYRGTFNMKIQKQSPDTARVALLTVYCTTHGTELNRHTLYDSSFQASNTYQAFELDYNIQLNCNPPCDPPVAGPSRLAGGVVQRSLSTDCRVDTRVWWYGNRTTWLDRVDIEDDVAYALFRRSNDGAIIQDAREFVGAYPNVKRFCSLDEPPVNAFRSYRYVDRLIMDSVNLGQNSNGRGRTITAFNNAIMQNNVKWFLNDAQPREIMPDLYVIHTRIPSPSMTDSQARDVGVAEYNGDNANYTSRLDSMWWQLDNLAWSALQTSSNGGSFWFVPQLHGVYRPDQSGWYWGIFKGDSTIRVTGVIEENELPGAIRLHQAYPKSFNPTTTIEYDLKQRSFVTLKVYNTLGQEIRTLINKEQDAGQHSIQFDGKGLSSGTYFYEIIVQGPDGTTTRQTKKMLLLSEREKQAEDEYERHLLTIGLAGDDAALKELARLQYKHAGGRFKQFVMDPDYALPDSINQQRLQQLGFMK
jgi:hypothetical protein